MNKIFRKTWRSLQDNHSQIVSVSAIASPLISALLLTVGMLTLKSEIGTYNENTRKQLVLNWQYDILRELFNADQTKGHTFSEIRGLYLDAVIQTSKPELRDSEFSDFAIRSLLHDLNDMNVIVLADDGKYYKLRQKINPRYDRAFIAETAELSIIEAIAKEPRQHTALTLEALQELRNLETGEFHSLLGELLATGKVVKDSDGKLQTRSRADASPDATTKANMR